MSSQEERMAKLRALKDQDIDYSDILETNKDFWKTAKVVMPTRINSVLSSYIHAKNNDYTNKD
jgi:hypothetical protein